MSTQNQQELESYKLSHEEIERISARRLKNHSRKIFRLDRSYYCGCCGMPYYDIYTRTKEDGQKELDEHNAIKRYYHYIMGVLKAKPDYENVLNDVSRKIEKKENRKNKGAQKLSKSKRKSIKMAESRRKTYLENVNRLEKGHKHSKR